MCGYPLKWWPGRSALHETNWRVQQFVQLDHEGVSSMEFRNLSMHLSTHSFFQQVSMNWLGRPEKFTIQISLQVNLRGKPHRQQPQMLFLWIHCGSSFPKVTFRHYLSMMGVLEPGYSCPTWDFSKRQSLYGSLLSPWRGLSQNCPVVWGFSYPIFLPSLSPFTGVRPVSPAYSCSFPFILLRYFHS